MDYDDSIAFYYALFGWLSYSSFSSLNMEYQSVYYMTRHVDPHSYVGIQPAAPQRHLAGETNPAAQTAITDFGMTLR